MKCKKCRKQIPDGSKFCNHCGTPTKQTALYRRPDGLYEKIVNINGKRVAFRAKKEADVFRKISEYEEKQEMDKIDDNDNDPYELVDVYLKLSCNGFSMNSMREMLNLDKIENCNVNKSKHRPTNCVNCGAILHGNQCEYCGTEYN